MLQLKDTENLGLVPFIPRYCFIAAPAWSRLTTLSQIITRSPGQQRLSSSSKLSVITLMPGLFLWVPRALCVLSPPAKAGQQQLSLWLPVGWGPGACLGRARPLSSARHPEDFWAAHRPPPPPKHTEPRWQGPAGCDSVLLSAEITGICVWVVSAGCHGQPNHFYRASKAPLAQLSASSSSCCSKSPVW